MPHEIQEINKNTNLNTNNPGIGDRSIGLEAVDGGVEAVGRHRERRSGRKSSSLDEAKRGSRIASTAIHRRQTDELLIMFLPIKIKDDEKIHMCVCVCVCSIKKTNQSHVLT